MLYSMMLNALRKVKPTIPVSQVLLFCIAFGGLPLDAPAAIGGTLEAKDYLEFERVADPQISPDGQTILYTRRWIDRREDRWRSEIWVRKTNSDAHHFLLRGSNPRWSPSGNRVLFQAPDKYGRNQLFVARYPIAGEATQITRIASAPFSATWSPDGKQIAFVSIVPQKDQWSVSIPPPDPEGSWTEAPRVISSLHYRQDRLGFQEPGFSHLFVVDADGGTARQLTNGNWNVGAQFDGLFSGAGLSWSKSGTTLLFDGLRNDSGDFAYRKSHIYEIDLSSGEIQQLTREEGYWRNPVVSESGKYVAFLGHPETENTYALERPYLMDDRGSNVRLLSNSFDYPVTKVLWSKDDSSLFLSAQAEGHNALFQATVDGEISRISRSGENVQLTSLASNGEGAAVVSSLRAPADVYAVALEGDKALRPLTAVNEDLFASRTLSHSEEIRFTGRNGTPLQGWVVTPPNFSSDKTYPLILEIHGGPFAMYRGEFNFMYELLAAQGYVVFYMNPRGSTGYGEEFSLGINKSYPSVDYEDLLDGVAQVVDNLPIDQSRLYVGGCSGGGVLSSWAIGMGDQFAAASVRCPVSNWLSMAGTTDIPGFTYSFFDTPFWEDPEAWLAHSPLMLAGQVTTPTIIMTGEQDLRTPMAQSEEYFSALKMRNIPSHLIRFNEQYHGTGTRPSNWIRTVLYMADWYGRWQRAEDGGIEERPSPSPVGRSSPDLEEE